MPADSFHGLLGWCSEIWSPWINHLWQGTLYGILALLSLILLRNIRAKVRHGILLLAMIKFLVPAHWFVWLFDLAGIPWQFLFQVPSRHSETGKIFIRLAESVSPAAAFLGTASPAPPASIPWPLVVLSLWMMGCLIFFAIWLFRWQKTWRSLKKTKPVFSGKENLLLEKAKARLGTRRAIGLRRGSGIKEPAVWGIWRPIVVLPEGISGQLTEKELEAIFLHELAHVQRHDNFFGVLSHVLTSLYWFHPLAWMLDRHLIEEQELACDEVVLKNADRRDYALGIAKAFHWSVLGHQPGASFASGSGFRKRFERIISPIPLVNGFLPNLFPSLTAFALLVLLTLAAGQAGTISFPLFSLKKDVSTGLMQDYPGLEIVTSSNSPVKVTTAGLQEETAGIQLVFRGNRVFSDSQLAAAMNLSPLLARNEKINDALLRQLILEGAGRIRQFLIGRGFVAAQVNEPAFGDAPGKLQLEIPISEGPLFKIGRIGFEYSKVFTERQLMDLFPLKAGESAIGFQEKIREGLEILKRSYENLGYLDWVPIPRQEILENEGVLNVTFDMEEGPAFTVRKILLTGVEEPVESLVRSELVLMEGQPFNWEALEESSRRIQRSGLAAPIERNSVELRPNHTSHDVEVVIAFSSNMNPEK